MNRFIFFLVFLASNLSAQSVTKEYMPIDGVIANPERGFYHHTEVHSGNYILLNENTLKNYRENESITQILRVFYLEDFLDQPISASYLANMQRDFNIMRAAGVKAVVRFAYTKDSSPPYGDAKPEIVFTHIRQLNALLKANNDVVLVIQTGFVGAWGEWYYTDHFAGYTPSAINEQNWNDRRQVVSELLNSLPENRMIQIRTPGYKMRIFRDSTPLNEETAFNKSNIARVGHHNDCFVASSSDYGTYVNPLLEKPYLEEDTKYTPMGGETCNVSPPYSDCENAMSDLKRFHWSYLNIDYNQSVLNVWRAQGCFDEVERNLGYRYVLKTSNIKNEINPQGTFELNLNLINEGFANPFNEKKVIVYLDKINGEKQYRLILEEDVRRWPLNQEFDLTINAGLADGFETGEYKVSIAIKDEAEILHNRPEYSIRFANENIWNHDDGTNELDLILHVSAEFESETYEGNKYFDEALSLETQSFGPKDLYGAPNAQGNLLFWGRTAKGSVREISKTTNGSDVQIITIPGSIDYWLDTEIEQGQEYTYQFSIIDSNTKTPLSDSLTLTNNFAGNPSTAIVVDGKEDDWNNILPFTSGLDASLNGIAARGYFSKDSLFLIINGAVDDYTVLLNIDHNEETGNTSNAYLGGVDLEIYKDRFVAYYEDGIFEFGTDEFSMFSDEKITEIGIPLDALGGLNLSTSVPVVIRLEDKNLLLSGSNDQSAFIFRVIPPDIPQEFTVSNSAAYPDIRLEISWEKCEHCDGYEIERSADNDTFALIKTLDANKDIYYDDFLETGTYYYRMRSFNSVGYSDYTAIKEGSVVNTGIKFWAEEIKSLDIKPNPASHFIQIGIDYKNLIIYNSSGVPEIQINQKMDAISIQSLSSGLYFIKVDSDSGPYIGKFIKI